MIEPISTVSPFAASIGYSRAVVIAGLTAPGMKIVDVRARIAAGRS